MIKEFNEHEFRLYGNVQSFFYRCWSMWGAHPEAISRTSESLTKIYPKLELMGRWCESLFPYKQIHYHKVQFVDQLENGMEIPLNIEPEEHNIVQLIIQCNRALNHQTFTVDLRHNLEDYDFYNIKWISNVEPLGEPLDKKPTHIYKAVPKVF
jgi:hypothetical protein